MKSLNKLTPEEKAELLFELFPEELPGLIEFSKELTQSIIDHPEKMKTSLNLLHSTPFWFDLVNKAKGKFETLGSSLAETRMSFSNELFSGYDYIYTSYCLHQYMVKEKYTNRKFKEALMLFFF